MCVFKHSSGNPSNQRNNIGHNCNWIPMHCVDCLRLQRRDVVTIGTPYTLHTHLMGFGASVKGTMDDTEKPQYWQRISVVLWRLSWQHIYVPLIVAIACQHTGSLKPARCHVWFCGHRGCLVCVLRIRRVAWQNSRFFHGIAVKPYKGLVLIEFTYKAQAFQWAHKKLSQLQAAGPRCCWTPVIHHTYTYDGQAVLLLQSAY